MVFTKTGGVCPKSGQYVALGQTGEITLSKGDRVPPVGGVAATLYLVDATKHRSR